MRRILPFIIAGSMMGKGIIRIAEGTPDGWLLLVYGLVLFLCLWERSPQQLNGR